MRLDARVTAVRMVPYVGHGYVECAPRKGGTSGTPHTGAHCIASWRVLQNTRVPWHDACAKQAVASRHVCGGAGRPLNGLFAEWSVMG